MDLRRQQISGQDFSDQDISGWDISHTDITGCKFGVCAGTRFVFCKGSAANFHGADVTNATFEKADESVLQCLMGAMWNGQEIIAVSPWLVQDPLYWSFATNVFVQNGCLQKTIQEWDRICASLETIKELHNEQPSIDLQASFDWWQRYKDTIHEWIINNTTI